MHLLRSLLAFSIITFSSSHIFGQNILWHVYTQATIHGSAKLTHPEGANLKSGLTSGWEFGLGGRKRISDIWELGMEYGYGSTPTLLRIYASVSEYPFLRQDTKTSFYFVQHPYHSLKLSASRRLTSGKAILQFDAGLRIYPGSSASVGVANYEAVTNSRIIVFSSSQRVTLPLCPDFRVGITGVILKRFPAFKYRACFSFSPLNAVKGSYIFFPDKPDYTFSGNYTIRESFLGVGIVFCRDKIDD